jgi:hypothetical protein
LSEKVGARPSPQKASDDVQFTEPSERLRLAAAAMTASNLGIFEKSIRMRFRMIASLNVTPRTLLQL